VGLGSFVIGPLRQWLSLEQIYQLSTLYPVLAIGLAGWACGFTAASRRTIRDLIPSGLALHPFALKLSGLALHPFALSLSKGIHR
jgi:hypothetical protein